MSADKNKTALQELLEFEMSKKKAARESSGGNRETGQVQPKRPEPKRAVSKSERRLFERFKQELIFVRSAMNAQGVEMEDDTFPVLLSIMQVPELRERLADWLERPSSLIFEGEEIAALRQYLRDTVTNKPPGNQDKLDWYTFQLETDHGVKLAEWVDKSFMSSLLNKGFQEFLNTFSAKRKENEAFTHWLKENHKPLSYRSFRDTAVRLRTALSESIKGQDTAIDGVCDAYAQSVLRKSSGPRGIFTLLGAPGTGKTFLAETFAKALPRVEGENYQILKFSMEQFNHSRANGSLFGTGSFYTEAALGQLTDPVRNVPKTIIIFDEIEKAHPEVIQSLLGVLDRGIGKDVTSLKEADFSQAFIFFTTNLGQQVLENRRNSGQVLGTLDAQSVVSLLQNTEANPRGLSPEFLSRLGKGKFLVFEELPASSLIEIYTNAWNASVSDSQVETSVPECSTGLATVHLLSHLPSLSARAAASAPEQDLVEYMDRALEEFDASGAGHSSEYSTAKIEGVRELLTVLLKEYDLQSPLNVLLIDDDKKTSSLLEEELVSAQIRLAPHSSRASDLLGDARPDLIIIDLVITGEPNDGGNASKAALQQAIDLRTQFPGVPILIFGLNLENSAENHRLFRLAKNFQGVAGALVYRSDKPEGFVQWVNFHLELLSCARLVNELRRSQKRLTFSWKGQLENGQLVMSPDLTRLEQAVSAEDIGGVAGLGQVPTERIADVVGNERAVKKIFQAVGWLSKPKEIGKFGISPPSGYLLEGPPGTGKTFLAKAVAGECGLPFFSVNGADFVQRYYGESGRLVRELFAKARQYAPSIIFIDEIDAFAMSRDQERRPEVSGINALLSEMDGFDSRKHPVLVLAATNYRSRLDPALLRAGRFDEVIVCDLPNKSARLEMIRRGYEKVGLDASTEEVESLAMRTQGSSAADIDALIREAIYQAVSEDREPTIQDVEEACARVVYGSVRTDLKLAQEEKWSTACHEAGHALASHLMMPDKKLDYLSIQPRTDSLGFVSYREDSENPRGAMSMTAKELKAHLIVFLAGREAERILLGAEQMSTGATSDLSRANELAYHAITECGLDEELGPVTVNVAGPVSGKLSGLVTERLRHWLAEAEKQCFELLSRHREPLTAVAEFLNEHESMEGSEFLDLVGRKSLFEFGEM